MIDIGQVEGGYVFGLGFNLLEDIVYDPNTGVVLNDGTWVSTLALTITSALALRSTLALAFLYTLTLTFTLTYTYTSYLGATGEDVVLRTVDTDCNLLI
jgi:hypothetical protein